MYLFPCSFTHHLPAHPTMVQTRQHLTAGDVPWILLQHRQLAQQQGAWAMSEVFKLISRYCHKLPQKTGWKQSVQRKAAGKNGPTARTLLFSQKTLELKGGH